MSPLFRRRLTAEETFAYDPADDEGAPPPARRRRGVLARAARVLVMLFAGYYVLCLLLLVAYRFVSPPITGVQLQRRLEGASRERHPVALTAMSKHVPRAVVAAEDGRFWSHHGYDVREMRVAGVSAAGGGRMRGASTITQQLVKNLFGCACRNPVRKLYDLTLTPAAELILGKKRILELYLNEVEWGKGIYGVDAAARHRYGVGADRLSRSQAAGLAALLPNPRQRTTRGTGEYRGEILRRMRYRGW